MSKLFFIETNADRRIILAHNGLLAGFTAYDLQDDEMFTAACRKLDELSGDTEAMEAAASEFLAAWADTTWGPDDLWHNATCNDPDGYAYDAESEIEDYGWVMAEYAFAE